MELHISVNDEKAELFLQILKEFKNDMVKTFKIIPSDDVSDKEQKERNLEEDPYFYERKDKLHKMMDKIYDNPSKLTNFEDFEITMDKLEKKLEANHAD